MSHINKQFSTIQEDNPRRGENGRETVDLRDISGGSRGCMGWGGLGAYAPPPGSGGSRGGWGVATPVGINFVLFLSIQL